ncbi:PP2C family protein-serine/threonine phosphatase [Butyrivibrio sp. AE2032]|uniref:PP2C family protein-serine/threonine phosphatase n=1 Tax=Butyrivibrio sp. AE2032 TaxID=1458463 RepID=UPI00068AF51F|nr:PP2C family protein-serine/threonine phosphatase [Butyrivibrio sp. AE2032]
MGYKKDQEERYVSLQTKAFRIILVWSLIIILVGSTVGILLHTYSSLRHYKEEADHLLDSMMALQDSAYIEKIFRETQRIYYSLPEKVLEDQSSDEFDNAFRPLVDDDFDAARDILVKFRENSKRRNVFLMFQDIENSRVVYVVDGDEDEWAYLPGQWTDVDVHETEIIVNSQWRLAITHDDVYGWIGSDAEAIYGQNGEFLGYAVVDLDMNDFLQTMLSFLLILIPLAVLLVVLFAVLFAKMLKKDIITHLISLSTAAREYTQMDKVNLAKETPSVYEPLRIETADEIEDLWKSMTVMEADIKDSIIKMREITAVQERMDAELSIATRIQMGMLPDEFPDRTEYDLYASMEPALEVGGDLYDFFMVDDTHLAMVIADVSDKGVSAALFMVVTKTMIRSQTEQGLQDPAVIFDVVNRKLMEVNRAYMFVTAWLGILDLESGRLVYVNAGHEYPVIRRAGGLFELYKDEHSVPLAAREDVEFVSGEFTVGRGDTLFLYTDGVPEANNEKEELLGADRMIEILNREPDAAPKEVIENVKDGISEFVKGAEQFDDTTMLCLKFNGIQ